MENIFNCGAVNYNRDFMEFSHDWKFGKINICKLKKKTDTCCPTKKKSENWDFVVLGQVFLKIPDFFLHISP